MRMRMRLNLLVAGVVVLVGILRRILICDRGEGGGMEPDCDSIKGHLLFSVMTFDLLHPNSAYLLVQ
jgi:hypothetical protein